MKSRFKYLIIVFACVVVLMIMMRPKKNSSSVWPQETQTTVTVAPNLISLPVSLTVATPQIVLNQPRSPALPKKNEMKTELPGGPLSVEEIQSVNQIVKTIAQAISQKSNSQKFMKALLALQLEPKFIDQQETSLGSMVTVRTENSLEGTRYLHAQFAGEKNNADYLEHISFQIRPGSNSFQKAVEVLNQFLPKNKITKESYSDYVLYNTFDGYVAWAKIGNREDLKSNKYNAFAPEDMGTVIVTIEQEIHDMDHDDHQH